MALDRTMEENDCLIFFYVIFMYDTRNNDMFAYVTAQFADDGCIIIRNLRKIMSLLRVPYMNMT